MPTKKLIQSFSKCIVILVLLLAGVLLTQDQKEESMLLHGDFLAFYTAAKIVREAAPLTTTSLYDWERQKAIQSSIVGYELESFQPYIYPPYVALVVSPLSLLPPLLAKWLWVLVMFGCYCFAMDKVKHLKLLPSYFGLWEYAALLFAFPPLGIGILGGQNTALSFLIYTLIVCHARSVTLRSQGVVGASLGFGLFKPQVSLSLMPAVLCATSPLILLFFLGVALFWFVVSASFFGSEWVFEWYTAIQSFSALVATEKLDKTISLPGAISAIEHAYRVPFSLSMKVLVYAVVFSGIGAWVWSRSPVLSSESLRMFLLCLAGPLSLFISPHALYYEFGLSLLSFTFAWPYLGIERKHGTAIMCAMLLVVVANMCPMVFPLQSFFLLNTAFMLYLLFGFKEKEIQ